MSSFPDTVCHRFDLAIKGMAFISALLLGVPAIADVVDKALEKYPNDYLAKGRWSPHTWAYTGLAISTLLGLGVIFWLFDYLNSLFLLCLAVILLFSIIVAVLRGQGQQTTPETTEKVSFRLLGFSILLVTAGSIFLIFAMTFDAYITLSDVCHVEAKPAAPVFHPGVQNGH